MKISIAETDYIGMSIATLFAQHNEIAAVDIEEKKLFYPFVKSRVIYWTRLCKTRASIIYNKKVSSKTIFV